MVALGAGAVIAGALMPVIVAIAGRYGGQFSHRRGGRELARCGAPARARAAGCVHLHLHGVSPEDATAILRQAGEMYGPASLRPEIDEGWRLLTDRVKAAGVVLEVAWRINGKGQIAGTAVVGGHGHGFLARAKDLGPWIRRMRLG